MLALSLQRRGISMENKRKIGVIFPGIGYHCDKPLLYYGKKALAYRGYEIVEIKYKNVKTGMKIDEAAESGYEEACAQLDGIFSDKEAYEDIVFISKSVGTYIAGRYSREHDIKVRNIFSTPLNETMKYITPEDLVFHGDADPLADTEKLRQHCEKIGAELYVYPGGNHSIERKDVLWNVDTLRDIVEKYVAYIDKID
jgi:phosphoglycolate phosphatase